MSPAAADLDALPRMDRDLFPVLPEAGGQQVVKALPEVGLEELLVAFRDVLRRAEMFTSHHIQREALSVRERMSDVLSMVAAGGFTEFARLFPAEEGRTGVVVTFLALLELVREQLLERVRDELPHAIACRVTEWEWPRVRVEILVERESQKGMVIGRGGTVLKEVGTAVRRQLPPGAYLELHVTVERRWQMRPDRIDRLGY